ncbi:cytochrome P450 [Kutzneria viridogrisea]|uniref:Cytochrome P450 n=1 Tax=Kutzneria viridogrisea TaxID=47990 RepID=A0ABR6BTZ4_9PSEU|nr:cytochrome P450 [Kutzneria viridogrisea]
MPESEIALFSEQYWDRATEVAARLREQGPVHRAVMPNGLPVWVVTRYQDARAALTDPRLCKDADRLNEIMRGKLAAAGASTELLSIFSKHMLMADPPDHTRLRRLLAREFTARRVELLRPRVAEITAELLDALPAGEPVDLVERFAFPLPVTVISELLGIPLPDRAQFRRWTADFVQERSELSLPASRSIVEYLTGLIAAKRAEPGEDLLSALTIASEDGDKLAERELLATAILLLIAGHETTANLIANGALYLVQRPELWRELAQRPESVPPVVEELLRVDGPVRMSTSRFTSEPVDIGGTTVPEGEVVLVAITSANHDSDRFDRAAELDPGRGSGHLSFGHGIHYCLGAPLARLEGEIALGQLVRRFSPAELLVPAEQVRRRHSAIMNGIEALPLRLQAAGQEVPVAGTV